MIFARILLAFVLLTGGAQAQMNSFFPGPGTVHSAGGATTTYNPSDKSANITLSGGNLVATNNTGSAFANVRAVASQSSGKFFHQVTFTTQNFSSFSGFGIANSTASLTNFIGGDVNSVNATGNGSVNFNGVTLGSWTGCGASGCIAAIAVDLTAKKIWAWESSTGQWNADILANQNPATGTGGYSIAALTCPCFPITEIWQLNDVQTANFGATAYTIGTPPSGFSNW